MKNVDFNLQISQSKPLLLGGVFGVVGFLLNLLNLPIAFGLDFILGSFIPLLVLRIFGFLPSLVSAVIASAATIVLWNHPYAAVVYVLEIIVISFLFDRKQIPLYVSAVIFWFIIGGPLLLLFYGYFLKFSFISLIVVVAKQIVNGLIHVLIAEALFALFVLYFKNNLNQKFKLRIEEGYKSSELVQILFILFALIPVAAIMVYQSRSFLEERLSIEAKTLRQVNLLVESQIRSSTQLLATLALNKDNDPNGSFSLFRGVLSVSFVSQPGGKQVIYQDGFGRLSSLGLDQFSYESVVFKDKSSFRKLQIVVDESFFSQFFAASQIDEAIKIKTIRGIIPSYLRDLPNQSGSRPGLSKIKGTDDGWIDLTQSLSTNPMQRWRNGVIANLKALEGWNFFIRTEQPLLNTINDYNLTLFKMLAFLCVFLGAVPLFSSPLSAQITAEQNNLVLALREKFSSTTQQFSEVVKELRRQSEIHRFNRERLGQLFDVAPAVFFIAPFRNEKIASDNLFVSQSVTKILGYSAEELSKAHWFEGNIHPDDLIKVQSGISELNDKRYVNQQFRFRHKNGKWLEILNSLALVKNVDSGDEDVLGLWLDQTELVHTQRKIVQASKMADLGQMATSMAHELNQPLNIIELSAANLAARVESGVFDNKYIIEKVERIRKQVKRAANIIDHMRVFGRVDDGAATVFSLNSVFEYISDIYKPQLAKENIEFVISLSDVGLKIKGSETLLEQVIVNLLVNARYQLNKVLWPDHENKINKKIWLKGRLNDSKTMVQIIFSDNGGGISSDVFDKVFEPFVTGKEVGEGTGLGLSVVFGIVHDLNGTISVANTDVGAEFTISFPAVAG